MGVKFNREYKEIVQDIAKALYQINDSYEAFEMTQQEWNALESEEQADCLQTLADDIFYGLGSFPKQPLGSGSVEYDGANHLIKVYSHENVVHVIKLI